MSFDCPCYIGVGGPGMQRRENCIVKLIIRIYEVKMSILVGQFWLVLSSSLQNVHTYENKVLVTVD